MYLDTRKGGGPSSIFSISVDSSGKRLASAGLDSTIRIWNLEALRRPQEDRLLAAMTRHDGKAMIVGRKLSEGRFLDGLKWAAKS